MRGQLLATASSPRGLVQGILGDEGVLALHADDARLGFGCHEDANNFRLSATPALTTDICFVNYGCVSKMENSESFEVTSLEARMDILDRASRNVRRKSLEF